LRLNFKYFLNPTLLLQFDDFGYITLSPDFPASHSGFSETVLRKFNWMQTFSHDRQGRKKGLLEIRI